MAIQVTRMKFRNVEDQNTVNKWLLEHSDRIISITFLSDSPELYSTVNVVYDDLNIPASPLVSRRIKNGNSN